LINLLDWKKLFNLAYNKHKEIAKHVLSLVNSLQGFVISDENNQFNSFKVNLKQTLYDLVSLFQNEKTTMSLLAEEFFDTYDENIALLLFMLASKYPQARKGVPINIYAIIIQWLEIMVQENCPDITEYELRILLKKTGYTDEQIDELFKKEDEKPQPQIDIEHLQPEPEPPQEPKPPQIPQQPEQPQQPELPIVQIESSYGEKLKVCLFYVFGIVFIVVLARTF
jgi:hypothetical protein